MSSPSTPLTSAQAQAAPSHEEGDDFVLKRMQQNPQPSQFGGGSLHQVGGAGALNYGSEPVVTGTLVEQQPGGGAVGLNMASAVAAENDTVVISSPYYLYRGVPSGMDTYTWVPQEKQLYWNCKRCCCCGYCPQQPEGDLVQLPGANNPNLTLVVAREPFSCLRITRDGFLSFIFAMLFHFVPAVLSGVEQALGSAENHQRWGMVWFGLWPIWWLIASVLLRPWGVRIVDHSRGGSGEEGGCCGGDVYLFLPCATHDLAVEMVDWLRSASAKTISTKRNIGGATTSSSSESCPPPAERGCLRPGAVIGTSLLIFLLAWGIHTAMLIQECNNLGCCKDDGKTLANCTRIWDER